MALTVIERCQISPPRDSVPTTTLPLSFLDVQWFLCPPVQYIYLYDFVHPLSYFVETALPCLKASLSSALVDFFPFAGNVVIPHHPRSPQIVYMDGDSLSLTVAESTMDFDRLVSSPLQDAAVVHPLVPHLPPSRVSEDVDFVAPVMAIQITVFSNSGICIGLQFLHVAADGKSFQDFMKAWASIHRYGADSNHSGEERIRPFHDRRAIRDPNERESIILKKWLSSNPISVSSPVPVDKVRGTFHLNKSQLDRLKDLVLNKSGLKPKHVSKFVVACAFMWYCLINAQDKSPEGDDDTCRFLFLADCRSRLGYSIPSSYFGNCLAIKFVRINRDLLMGKGGIAHAAEAIGDKVKETEEDPLKGMETWFEELTEFLKAENLVTVAGSPRFRVYDTDFKWGKPRKFHRVHLDDSKAFGMSDARHGGDDVIEIDLALEKLTMQRFVSVFSQLDP